MKTYSSSNKNKSKRTKLIYALVAALSVIVIVTTIILAVALSEKPAGMGDTPVVDAPVDQPSDTPDQPSDTPDQPSDTPDQPSDTPDQPSDTPDQPSDTPDQPSDTPDQPSDTPDQPSDTPVDTPTVPEYAPPVSGEVIRECALDALVYMPSLNMYQTHNGVDFAATEGETVMSVADGTVTNVQETTLEGVVVTVEHADGVTSIYKSLASATVSIGDMVEKGGSIGTAGTMMTELSDGVHVHLEMTVDGELVDPLTYVDSEIIK